MAATYKIREVRIEVRTGVTVVADVDSIDALSALLNDLDEADLAPAADSERDDNGRRPGAPGGGVNPPAVERHDTADSATARVEKRAGIATGSLHKANILGFKNDVPQLQRPSAMTPTDAVLVLLYAVENGLQKTKIDVEAFKGLYEAQNIKSGSPLRMKLTDLRNAGYLDKSAYSADKSLTLTSKGENKAVEVIKDLVGK